MRVLVAKTINMKILQAIKNHAGGYDLMTERDRGNEIRILTGKPSASLDYWARLLALANDVVNAMETIKPEFQPKDINC